jgi:microcystin-dependent protein
MAYTTFESDLLDTSSSFAYIPTGAILMLAGPYSRLSDADLASLGLLKCDGTSHLVATYQNLYNVIGYVYGGSGLNFNVPNLHATKLAIEGAPSTTIGTITNTENHTHDVGTVTWNSNNNAPVDAAGTAVAMTHTHNAYTSNRVFITGNPAAHEHNGTPGTMPTGVYNVLQSAANKQNDEVPNNDASSATNGNTGNTGSRQHNHVTTFNAYNTNSATYTAHTHTIPSQALGSNTQYNTGTTAFTNIHLHPVTLNTSNSSNSITGYPVPYSPMLYFIKA